MLAGWPFGLLYWPLGALFGPVVAWNLLLLGTIVAAGLVTYLWLRALDLGPWAAAIGGLAFAVAPYRLDQSASGHLLGWASLFIPLALTSCRSGRPASACVLKGDSPLAPVVARCCPGCRTDCVRCQEKNPYQSAAAGSKEKKAVLPILCETLRKSFLSGRRAQA